MSVKYFYIKKDNPEHDEHLVNRFLQTVSVHKIEKELVKLNEKEYWSVTIYYDDNKGEQ